MAQQPVYKMEMMEAEEDYILGKKKRPRVGGDPAPAPRSPSAAPEARPGGLMQKVGGLAGAAMGNPVAAAAMGAAAGPMVDRAVQAGTKAVGRVVGAATKLAAAAAAKAKPVYQQEMMEANEPKFGAAAAAPAAPSKPNPHYSRAAELTPEQEFTYTMNDTEQGRRDLAMLKKKSNLQTAELMGRSNRYSAFNPQNPAYSPDRADLILEREMVNQQLATAQRAANPPRYAANPDGDATQTAAAEEGMRRNRQAQEQYGFDQARRDKERGYQIEYRDAQANAALQEQKARGTMATAAGSRAEAEAINAGSQANIAKTQATTNELMANAQANLDAANATKASTPNWYNTVASVAGAIARSSGKDPGQADTRMLEDGIRQFEGLPPDAQKLAAAEILSQLEQMSPGLSLDKQALESSNWRRLNWLAPPAALASWITETPIPLWGEGIATATGAAQHQKNINELLGKLRGLRDSR